MNRNKLRQLLPIFLAFFMALLGIMGPMGTGNFSWHLVKDQAVAGLYGEYWDHLLCMGLLGAAPVVVVLGYFLERVVHARKRWTQPKQPSEFATAEARKEFYLKELYDVKEQHSALPKSLYAMVATLLIGLFVMAVILVRLPAKTQAQRADLDLYESGKPAVYTGMLRQVERPVVDGYKQVPNDHYVYYQGENSTYFRCNKKLLSETNLMQEAYTVTYLPNSITILSITDGEGVVRTQGAKVELEVPEHCWKYGDLIVPICDQVEGYDQLSEGGQRAFDLLYSQVFSSRVAERKAPTRSFDLVQPISSQEFRQVLDLYEAAGCLERYRNFQYRTDDMGTVRTAYCQQIIHSDELNDVIYEME